MGSRWSTTVDRDLYCTDPTQHAIPAGYDLDRLRSDRAPGCVNLSLHDDQNYCSANLSLHEQDLLRGVSVDLGHPRQTHQVFRGPTGKQSAPFDRGKPSLRSNDRVHVTNIFLQSTAQHSTAHGIGDGGRVQ